jgi:hypothetical protein
MLKRDIGRWDLVLLMINCIIGACALLLLTKRTKKIKAVAALPKTGFHCAGLAKLARTAVEKLCIRFAQTVASLNLVRRSRHIEGGFIPAGFLTANRLMPGEIHAPHSTKFAKRTSTKSRSDLHQGPQGPPLHPRQGLHYRNTCICGGEWVY